MPRPFDDPSSFISSQDQMLGKAIRAKEEEDRMLEKAIRAKEEEARMLGIANRVKEEEARMLQRTIEMQENERKESVLDTVSRIDAAKRDRDDERAGFAWTMFKALREQVEAFERTLTPEQETAAWLAHFGTNVILAITEIAYRHPHLIILKGEDENGRPRELLQHVSQVSLLLEAIPAKPATQARRIGFPVG